MKYSIEKELRQSVRTVAHEMRVPYDLIHRILKEDLQIRKLVVRFGFSDLRKNPAMFDDMPLQMDNARPHTAVITV